MHGFLSMETEVGIAYPSILMKLQLVKSSQLYLYSTLTNCSAEPKCFREYNMSKFKQRDKTTKQPKA